MYNFKSMYKSTQQTQTLQIHVQVQINIHNQTLTKSFIHTHNFK